MSKMTLCLHPRASSPGSSGAYTSPTSRPVTTHQNTHMPTNTDNCTSWSSSLNPVTIKAFTSLVGPTVPISRFEVYTGKKGSTAENNLGTRVVKTLTAELKGKEHHVFFDNFFTNERLLQDLLADDIYSCGTARKDRKGFPPALKQVKLPNSYGQPLLLNHLAFATTRS